jgi:hypothetical protein
MLGRPLPLDRALDELLAAVQVEVRRVITALMMTLRLPRDETLRLAHDVSASPGEALRSLANPRLVALLTRFDPRLGDTVGSGASDWGSLPERMHYISELFRSYHARESLFDAPD